MKLLLVEDDRTIARLLARNLGQRGFVTDLCFNGAEAVRQAQAIPYDVILLDWMLPDLDGLTACRELRRIGSTAPILMLTGRGELHERVLGLEAGADDYVVKPFQIEELVARIHALVRRSQGFHRLHLGELEIDRTRHEAKLAGKPLDLTTREYALLMCIAQRPGQVVTRGEIFAQVWPATSEPSSNLVDVHISRLRDKFGELAWMIETVRGKGYRLQTRADA